MAKERMSVNRGDRREQGPRKGKMEISHLKELGQVIIKGINLGAEENMFKYIFALLFPFCGNLLSGFTLRCIK